MTWPQCLFSSNLLLPVSNRGQISANTRHKETCCGLRSRLKSSLLVDCESHWSGGIEMKAASDYGNSIKLFQLIRPNGPWKSSVSETIHGTDGKSVTILSRALDRLTGHRLLLLHSVLIHTRCAQRQTVRRQKRKFERIPNSQTTQNIWIRWYPSFSF